MTKLRTILTLVIFAICVTVNGQADSEDTTTYHIGNGLRDTQIWLLNTGQIRTYFFCDICPGEELVGTFRIKGDTLFRRDTVHYSYEPHFMNPTDTVTTNGIWTDTLYFGEVNNIKFLFNNPVKFKKHVEYYLKSNDERFLLPFFRMVATKD